jgi:lysophospholipase L1-like esterase
MRLASRKNIAIGLALSFLSLSLALLFSEWIIRRVLPQNTLQQAKLVSPRVFAKSQLIPSSLIKNLDTQHICLTREFSVHYTTNSLGYRGPEFELAKPADTYRILMLGDSITFGWGVEDNQTFSYLLPELLDHQFQGKKLEIINAGYHDGYAVDNYYVYLKNQGLALNPDLIILNLFPWNDISDLKEMVWHQTDERELPDKITSTERVVRGGYHTEVVASNWKYRLPILRNSHLAILAMDRLEKQSPQLVEKIKKILRVRVPDNISQSEAEACIYQLNCSDRMAQLWQKLDLVLLGINDLLLDHQIPLVINLLPAHTQVFPLAEADNPDLVQLNPQQQFKQLFNQHQINYLDPIAYFIDDHSRDYFYHQDGHPTALGHQRLATALADYLDQQ